MKLFEPLELAPGLTLPNRIIMAPLTRNRASEGGVPNAMMADYYAQRASYGLLISEATPVNTAGHGYPATPGIHTDEQVEGWKKVTDAVHAAGGRIFLQLWHCGRISHHSYQPGKKAPPAPSPIPAKNAEIWKPDWSPVKDPVRPREMSPDEIDFTIADYRQATKNAKAAGFDGVEVHGANGYLINQFLTTGTNNRRDSYGGSIENRARFLFEVLDAVTTEWPDRTGLRLSPAGTFNDIEDQNREALYTHVIEKLKDYELTYLHIVEPRMFEDHDLTTYGLPLSTKTWRSHFDGTLISSGGHLRDSANILLNHAQADLIAFGRLAISNPDLPERLAAAECALNEYQRETFYGGGPEGYTDYPTLSESVSQPSQPAEASEDAGRPDTPAIAENEPPSSEPDDSSTSPSEREQGLPQD